MDKDTKKFIRLLVKKHGFRAEQRGKHVMVIGPGGEQFTLSATRSCNRAVKNMRGDVRRAGYAV